MKFRIWCDHPESDFYGWIDSKLHDTREQAEKVCEEWFKDSDGCAEYSIKEVNDKGDLIDG